MPTRTQILAATPRCPRTHLTANSAVCGRPLTWKHQHNAWACRNHGMITQPDTAWPRTQQGATA